MACQVEVGVEAGDEQFGVEVGRQPVGADEDLAGCGGGVGVDGGADLSHEGGGDAVAFRVADDGGRGRVVQAQDVEEVAADLDAVAGRQIAGGDIEAGQVRQVPGQQGALQFVDESLLGVVEAGAVEGLGDQAGQRGEDGAFVGGEGVRVVVGQDAAAHRPAGDDQREERPGLFAADLGCPGVGADHLGRRGGRAGGRRWRR
ncbi:hypothetical protein GCM10010320_67980 [Streptomyces caelestis]|nr:hypothetical protein GCM10010320_67980 [Streptomyces caelestis]